MADLTNPGPSLQQVSGKLSDNDHWPDPLTGPGHWGRYHNLEGWTTNEDEDRCCDFLSQKSLEERANTFDYSRDHFSRTEPENSQCTDPESRSVCLRPSGFYGAIWNHVLFSGTCVDGTGTARGDKVISLGELELVIQTRTVTFLLWIFAVAWRSRDSLNSHCSRIEIQLSLNCRAVRWATSFWHT